MAKTSPTQRQICEEVIDRGKTVMLPAKIITSAALELRGMGSLPDHLQEDLWIPCTMHKADL